MSDSDRWQELASRTIERDGDMEEPPYRHTNGADAFEEVWSDYEGTVPEE